MSVEVKIPAVGESITEVYLGEWAKSQGDAVGVDDVLIEIESDKATFEVVAPVAGILERVAKQPGDAAEVGEVIAWIDDSVDVSDQLAQRGNAGGQQATTNDGNASKSTGSSANVESGGNDGDRIMPAAARLLAEHGLRAGDVSATGPGGRLLKEDVLRHLDQQGGELTAGARATEAVPMTPIRRRIAQRLVESQQTMALLTTFNDVDMSAIMSLRSKHKDAFYKKHDVKLGFMSFFVKGIIEGLKQIPQLNARIEGDKMIYHNYYDIGVAIGGGKGLLVPVLRNAERMSFAEVEVTISEFADRARQNKIELSELQGGTFTVSNGGVYGSLLSTPIINPPQSGVLGMHRIEQRPVVVDGQIVARPMMYLALTYDHRIVDGREAVTFLKILKESLEDPARMLLEI